MKNGRKDRGNVQLSIEVTQEEKVALKSAAKKAGMNLTAYMLKKCLSGGDEPDETLVVPENKKPSVKPAMNMNAAYLPPKEPVARKGRGLLTPPPDQEARQAEDFQGAYLEEKEG